MTEGFIRQNLKFLLSKDTLSLEKPAISYFHVKNDVPERNKRLIHTSTRRACVAIRLFCVYDRRTLSFGIRLYCRRWFPKVSMLRFWSVSLVCYLALCLMMKISSCPRKVRLKSW